VIIPPLRATTGRTRDDYAGHRAVDYGATKDEVFEALKAAAVPGGGVAYSVGGRALQTLAQDGAFPEPSPPPPARSQRRKATPPPSALPPPTSRRGTAAKR
jgi:hypothetical protein